MLLEVTDTTGEQQAGLTCLHSFCRSRSPAAEVAGARSTTSRVWSTLSPCFTAPPCSFTGASLAAYLRTLLISWDGVTVSQKGPEAIIRQAPPSGMVACRRQCYWSCLQLLLLLLHSVDVAIRILINFFAFGCSTGIMKAQGCVPVLRLTVKV